MESEQISFYMRKWIKLICNVEFPILKRSITEMFSRFNVLNHISLYKRLSQFFLDIVKNIKSTLTLYLIIPSSYDHYFDFWNNWNKYVKNSKKGIIRLHKINYSLSPSAKRKESIVKEEDLEIIWKIFSFYSFWLDERSFMENVMKKLVGSVMFHIRTLCVNKNEIYQVFIKFLDKVIMILLEMTHSMPTMKKHDFFGKTDKKKIENLIHAFELKNDIFESLVSELKESFPERIFTINDTGELWVCKKNWINVYKNIVKDRVSCILPHSNVCLSVIPNIEFIKDIIRNSKSIHYEVEKLTMFSNNPEHKTEFPNFKSKLEILSTINSKYVYRSEREKGGLILNYYKTIPLEMIEEDKPKEDIKVNLSEEIETIRILNNYGQPIYLLFCHMNK